MPRGGLRMRSAAMVSRRVSEGGGLLSVTGISCPFRAVSLSPSPTSAKLRNALHNDQLERFYVES